MLINQLQDYLKNRGLRSINVNVGGVYLHTITVSQIVYLVTILDCPTGLEFTKDQYQHIQNQIREKLLNNTNNDKNQLTILCTNQVDTARNLLSETGNQWVIDTSNNRLILYENQSSDFLLLRKGIEDILSNLSGNNSSSDAQTYPNTTEYRHEPYYMYEEHSKVPQIRRYMTVSNTVIIILNILVFMITDYYNARQNSRLLDGGSLSWMSIINNKEYYRILSYMFLHSGLNHIANNMIVLFFIGDKLERATGTWKYTVIYFASGIIAGITSMSYNMLNNTLSESVGASGAIFGVVGAMAYIVMINRGRLNDISRTQMILFVIFSLYGGLTSQGVDNAAHIGGLLSGAVLAAILYRKPKISHGRGI